MVRQIIKIDEEKCDGCGACATACHEGAIAIIDGKAKLLRDDYCDGLGNCLPVCHTGAITFEQREAAEYNEAAVMAHKAESEKVPPLACGCPGSNVRIIERAESVPPHQAHNLHAPHAHGCPSSRMQTMSPAENENHAHAENAFALNSQLRQWPVQIKLVPPNAPYFNGANLLIAADCCAFAYGNFHNEFIKNRIVLVGCPKLDDIDYTEKLSAIIASNDIKSLTVTRMEVPCCGGIEHAAVEALKASGKFIPWRVVTISVDGQILEG